MIPSTQANANARIENDFTLSSMDVPSGYDMYLIAITLWWLDDFQWHETIHCVFLRFWQERNHQ